MSEALSTSFRQSAEANDKLLAESLVKEGVTRNSQGDSRVDWNKASQDYATGKIKANVLMQLKEYEDSQPVPQMKPKEAVPATKPSEPEKGTLGEMARGAVHAIPAAVDELAKTARDIKDWYAGTSLHELNHDLSPIGLLTSVGAKVGNMISGDSVANNTRSGGLNTQAVVGSVVDAPSTTAGLITKDVLKFVAPLAGINGALKTASWGTSSLASATIASAITDPHEKGLTNALVEADPRFKNPVIDYLKADPNDTNAEGRLKNIIGNLIGGAAVDGVIYGAKALKAKWFSAGKNPVEELTKAEEAMKLVNPDQYSKRIGMSKATATLGDDLAKTPLSKEAYAVKQKELEDTFNLAEKESADFWQFHGNAAANIREAEKIKKAADEMISMAESSAKEADDGVSKINSYAAYRESQAAQQHLEDRIAAAVKGSPDEAAAEVNPKITSAIQKVETAKTIDGTERRALIEELANRVEKLKQYANATAEATRLAGNVKSHGYSEAVKLKNHGLLNEDGTFNFGGLGAQDPNSPKVAEFLKALALNDVKSNVAGMATAAIAMAGGANAADGTQDPTLGDQLIVGALLAIGGKYAYKHLFKGTKTGESLANAVKAETESEIAKHTKFTSGLPQHISPFNLSFSSLNKPVPRQTKAQVDTLAAAIATGDDKAIAASLGDNQILNFSKIDTDSDLQSSAQAVYSVMSKQVGVATRGVKADEEVLAFAKNIGTDPKQAESVLNRLYGETGNLAEKILAAKSFMIKAEEDMRYLWQQALDTALPEDVRLQHMVAARKQTAVFANAVTMFKGSQTEVARGLAIMRMRLTSFTESSARAELDDLLNGLGGKEVNEEFGKKMLAVMETGDKKRLYQFANKTAFEKSIDTIRTVWYASILSGLSTHVVNFTGSALTAVEGVWERGLANTIGKIRGTKGAEHYAATDMLAGYQIGMKVATGIRAKEYADMGIQVGTVVEAARTRISQIDPTTGATLGGLNEKMSLGGLTNTPLEAAPNISPISSTYWGVDAESNIGKALDLSGKYLFSIPERGLVASDEFMKSTQYYGHLYMHSAAEARAKGLNGASFEKYVNEALTNPSPEAHMASLKAMRDNTFSTQLTGKMADLQKLANTVPFAWHAVSFLKTTTNILSHVADRLPALSMLFKRNRDAWAAGGVEKDLLLAKQATGLIYLGLGWELAANGILNGGNLAEDRKEAEKLAGFRPYGLNIDGKWLPVNRFDPVGMFFQISADYYHIANDKNVPDHLKDDYLAATQAIFGNLMESKGYLSSITNATNMFHGGDTERDRNIRDKALGKTIASYYPNLFKQFNNLDSVDPFYKEYWTLRDRIVDQMVGMSKSVYPEVDTFGKERKRQDYFFAEMNPSKAAQELYKHDIDLPKEPKAMGKVVMSARQYYQYMKQWGITKIDGKTFEETISDLVSSPEWTDSQNPNYLTDTVGDYKGGKEEEVGNIRAMFRQAVQEDFFTANPEFHQKVMQDKENVLAQKGGGTVVPIPRQKPYEGDNFIKQLTQ